MRRHGIHHDLQQGRDRGAGGVLQARDRLPKSEAAPFSVGGVELGILHPLQQRVGRYADRLRRFIDGSVGEKGADRLFLLASELGSVAVHWAQPGATCPWWTIAFSSTL